MKTLDEVITGMTELILSGKTADVKSTVRDALHYLKEYKDDKDELDSTRLAYLDILTDYVALKQYWAEQQENPPISWDELKAMEGKPVWIETKRYGSRWYLVEDTSYEEMIVFTGLYGESAPYFQEDLGKTWQAYRKEKKC